MTATATTDIDVNDLLKLPEGLVIPVEPTGISSGMPTGEDIDESPEVHEGRKPNISHLDDAVTWVDSGEPGHGYVPLFTIGDKLVIERYAHGLASKIWIDTQTYVVDGIDDDSGNLRLWNPDLMQHAMGNFVTGPQRGDKYKLAAARGESIGKKKRGRPKKAVDPKAPVKPVLAPGEKKKGRGRPAGAKNRPKEEILAAKAAKRVSDLAKKDKKNKKTRKGML